MKMAELVIDIGTKFITISQKGKGIVLKEPCVAMVEGRRGKLVLTNCGRGALGNKVNENQQLVFPVKGGIILHENAFVLMMRSFINRLVSNRPIFRQSVKAIACVSCGLTNTEKQQIEKCLIKAGVKEVIILESPIAVAAGVDDSSTQFVVDVGASKTEVAIVSPSGIISGCSVNIGGDTFNQAIIDYITDTKRCRMPVGYAEKAKKQVGSLYENDLTCINMDLQEIGTNRVFEYKITAKDIKNAVEEQVSKIVEVVYNLSFQIPENYAQEVYLNGITLSGGSALFPGLSEYISMAMEMQVNVSSDPTNDVVKGGMTFLEHKEKLGRVLNVGSLG
ncbi:MAG: rod shape-determining protein [Christensenellales bacterium]